VSHNGTGAGTKASLLAKFLRGDHLGEVDKARTSTGNQKRPAGIERLAQHFFRIHPAWQGRKWHEIREMMRETFREDARSAVSVYEIQD
jgi:hypothetical protein